MAPAAPGGPRDVGRRAQPAPAGAGRRDAVAPTPVAGGPDPLRGARPARGGVADLLGTTAASVTSALQRARARLREVGVDPDAQAEPVDGQRAVVDRYVAAFERADVAARTALLTDDVVLEMPPMWNWYRGPADFGAFMRRIYRNRGERWQTAPLQANGELGFAAYRCTPCSSSPSSADGWRA